MKVLAINGVGGAGKDEFVRLVNQQSPWEDVLCISTIDPVKKFYKQLGWDGEKTPEHRRNLNTLKRIWIEACNGPYEWTRGKILLADAKGVKVLFIMVREFSEMLSIVRLGKELVGNAATLQVIRPGLPIPPIEQEFLDSHPEDYKYDWTIMNYTTDDTFLTELNEKARTFWNTIRNGEKTCS